MKIFIIGNIGVGKSFLAELLSKELGYSILSIDKFRETFNNSGDIYGEKLAWDMLHKTVLSTEHCIVESTGCSKHYDAMIALADPKFIIKVIGPLQDKKTTLPYYNFEMKESIKRNELLLRHKKCDIIYTRETDSRFWKMIDVLFP
jgi:hypothetical protein